jgi:adenosylcobinamide kinase / adenosylcobinamide-phosphate guanylyltransferase
VPFDEELKGRVAKHQEDRLAGGWTATLEEPVALAGAIREAPASSTILVDCLTMWVGNLMWEAEQPGTAAPARDEVPAGQAEATDGPVTATDGPAAALAADPAPLSEAQIAAACSEVAAAARERGGTTVFVTNEVGLGIIPDNPASRLYRDLLGRCNQVMAAEADTVVLMVSGLPLVLKGREPLPRGGSLDDPAPDGRS